MFVKSMSDFLRHIGLTVREPIPFHENIDAGFLKSCVAAKVQQIANNLPQFLQEAGKSKAQKMDNFQVTTN